MWWLPLAELVGQAAVKLALSFLESKYAGFPAILKMIIGWLEQQPTDAATQAALVQLNEHLVKLIPGKGK